MDTLQQLKDELQAEYETTKRFFEIYPEEASEQDLEASWSLKNDGHELAS